MTKARTNADNVAGDISGVTAGTGLTGGGTSGTVTLTNDMATTIAAKGDILAGTANDAYSVLSLGSNDQVLTADSSTATGLKWAAPAAGGMTLISTTTLTGASVTLSSIPQTYNNLFLVIRNFRPSVNTDTLNMRFNGDSSSNRHYSGLYTQYYYETQFDFNATDVYVSTYVTNNTSNSLATVQIYDYANTATWKMADIMANDTASVTTRFIFRRGFGLYNQTSAISSLQFFAPGGNFTSGTILLYGVK